MKFWTMVTVFAFGYLGGCTKDVVSTSGCQDLNGACTARCAMEQECLHSTESNSLCMDGCLRELSAVSVPNSYHDCYAEYLNSGCSGPLDQINTCLETSFVSKTCTDGVTWQACDIEGCCGYADDCIGVCVDLGHVSGSCDLSNPTPSALMCSCSD